MHELFLQFNIYIIKIKEQNIPYVSPKEDIKIPLIYDTNRRNLMCHNKVLHSKKNKQLNG